MKRRLRHLYWTGIAITMVMATVAVAMMVKLKIDDSREALRSILHAASAWTMESTEDLQSMAESIASVSPPLRVTFLMAVSYTHLIVLLTAASWPVPPKAKCALFPSLPF